MTNFEQARQAVAARISQAPVEPWLKAEALADLERLRQAVSADAQEPDVEEGWKDYAKGETEKASIDESWMRREALAFAVQVPPSIGQTVLDRARQFEAYLRDGGQPS